MGQLYKDEAGNVFVMRDGNPQPVSQDEEGNLFDGDLQQVQPVQTGQAATQPRIRPSSMAKPPSLFDAGGDLTDTLYEGGYHLLSTYLRGVRKMRTNMDEALGIGDPNEIAATRAELAAGQAAADARFDPYEEASPIASQVPRYAMEMAIPGGQTVKGGIAIGAGLEGLKYSDNQLINALVGGLGGGAGQFAGSKINKFLFDGVTPAPGAQELVDAGIPLTTGQRAGGNLKWLEDVGTSAPFIGPEIMARRRDATQAYSPVAVSRALRDTPDLKLPSKVDSNGMAEANAVINQGYNDALDFDFDVQANDIARIKDRYANMEELAPREQAKLDGLVKDAFDVNINEGVMTGQSLKSLDSKLRFEEAKFNKSGDPYHNELGTIISDLRDDTMSLVNKVDPARYDRIRALDKSFARLRTLDKAAGSVGAKEGMFNPGQNKRALTVQMGPRMAAERTNPDLMFADNAQTIMGSDVNNSGTAERLMTVGASGGLVASLLSGTLPAKAAAGLIPLAGGTRTGQKAINKLLFDRPDNAATQALKSANLPGRAGVVAGSEAATDEELIRKLEEELGL